jgi:DNA-binding transcriptional LysR family regulator
MRTTLRQLQIFRAISSSGSTSAGAASIPISQSAASAALSELEDALGALLFDRIGKRLLLNDNGRALLPAALAMLDGARSIDAMFQSAEAGSADLRVFASTTIGNYWMPRLLAGYLERYPQSRIDLRIGNTHDVTTAVRDFAADLGLIEGPCHESELLIIPWLTDELVIVAASTHPLAKAAKRRKLKMGELRRGRWLLREPGSGTREAVEAALLPHLTQLESVMVLGSSEAIKYSAAEGLGITCLSRSVVQDLIAARRLTVLATPLPPLSRHLSLIHHRKKVLSASLRNFIAHCRARGK